MRACFFCRTHNFLCVIAPESPYYERYFRSHLKCELTPSDAKAERLFKKKERLASEIAAAYAKITRLRKQHRAVIKKLRDLGSREDRNILELKIDEFAAAAAKEDGQFPIPGALNSPSPRPSSFTALVGGEGFIDLFLRLLDSPGKNAEIPQGSS